MEIKRDIHLRKLIDSKYNGMIKVVTGMRRCGKSYLLFNLFCQHDTPGSGESVTFTKSPAITRVPAIRSVVLSSDR